MLDGPGIEILEEAESLALLARSFLGRVASTMGAMPVILPVRYATADGDIVFRAGAGAELRALAGSVVAFQVDSLTGDAAWHVLVVGPAREITSRRELESVAALGLEPWPHAGRVRWIRLTPEYVAGRRFPGIPRPA